MSRGIPSLRRKTPNRDPRRRIILFTEGSLTEPAYFRQLIRFSGTSLVSIQPEHGVPKTLLEKAKKFKRFEKRRFDSSSKDDSIWIVFDRDEHPYVNTVLSEAKTSGISVAFSNPCFELWLLLHLQDHDAPEDRKRIQQILDDVCPSYSKSKKEIDFNALSLRLDIACERATAMAKRRFDEGNEQGNPYTNVYSLIKDIRMDVAPK